METKCCTKCHDDKPIDEFAWRNKAKGTRQSICNTCRSECNSKLYQESANRRESIRISNNNTRSKNRAFCNRYKEFCGCSVCKSEDVRHWYMLEFHHTDKNKEHNISTMAMGYSIMKLKGEIRKCVVVCANCHRKIHFEMGL